jgi:predicted nucleic acid-binding Zn ribbon protein
MKGAAPRVVGELLVSAMPQLEHRLLVQRLRRTWSTVVGVDVARRTQPQALVNGCLQIVVDNSPWLHEMTLRAPELAARLQAECPTIRSVRFTLGTPPADASMPAARPVSRPSRLSDDDQRAIDAAAAAISDPDVAASARRLLARGWPRRPTRGTE